MEHREFDPKRRHICADGRSVGACVMIYAIVRDDGLFDAQIWQTGDKEKPELRLQNIAKQTYGKKEEVITKELTGPHGSFHAPFLGTFEALVTVAEEDHALLIIYRKEDQWEMYIPASLSSGPRTITHHEKR